MSIPGAVATAQRGLFDSEGKRVRDELYDRVRLSDGLRHRVGGSKLGKRSTRNRRHYQYGKDGHRLDSGRLRSL